jgi:long-subunit fatty acid transport protein
VPVGSFGSTYRPTPALELGASYTTPTVIHASGDATSANGPEVTIQSGGNPLAVQVIPLPDVAARCAKGGTQALLKACVDLALPQHATVGGRYKFLDRDGVEKGDVELDVTWENWSTDLATNYNVVVDAQVVINNQVDNGLDLKTSKVRHGLQDTYGVRLGGAYKFPLGANLLTVRGGAAYDTAAATKGWERVDLDGAARTTITAGASYKFDRYSLTAGAGYVYEGSRTNAGTCNPTANKAGCDGSGMDTKQDGRSGPDPINPLLTPDVQAQSPVNQGTMTSHYLLLMLGASVGF